MPATKKRCQALGSVQDEAVSETLILSVPEILAAVESLYADDLKPFGRVLLKRLRERAAGRTARSRGLPFSAVDPETMPRIDPRRLRRICESCRQLIVEPEDGREFSATFYGRRGSFLDVCSPLDVYPHDLWECFASYLETLEFGDMNMPGGRYACAMELSSRNLPFFAGFNLGQLCHVVQLAVSQKRLLGYSSEGSLVPYRFSEAWVKEQCAAVQSPMSKELLEVASWEETRTCLQNLLSSHAGPSGIAISSVKRLFRSVFNLELSVTALGHTRLLEVLTDPRLEDICALNTDSKGFMVTRALPMTPPGQWGNQGIACEDLTMGMLPVAVPVMCMGWQNWGFDHEQTSEVLVSPGASPPVSPRNYAGNGECWKENSCFVASSAATDSSFEDLSSLSDDTESSLQGSDTDDERSEAEEWEVEVKGTFIHLTSPKKTVGSKHRSRSCSFHL